MPTETPLDRIDDLLSKTERIFSAARWIILAILVGALWVARAEWNLADHERRLTSVEGDVKPMSDMLSRVKGHLGISAVAPKTPANSSVVWTEGQRREQERLEEEAQATH